MNYKHVKSPEEIEHDVAYMERITRRSAMTANISDERLFEICNAERDGRCVVLPCKVGAKLYTLFGVTVMEHTARRFSFQRTQSDADMKLYIHTNYGMIFAETIGKTVFLTRKAVEAALEARL